MSFAFLKHGLRCGLSKLSLTDALPHASKSFLTCPFATLGKEKGFLSPVCQRQKNLEPGSSQHTCCM